MRYGILLVVFLMLGVAPLGAIADDTPPTPAEDESDGERAVPLAPSEALQAIQLRVREAKRPEQRALQKALTQAYLEEFEMDEGTLAPNDLFALGTMRRTVEAWTAAAGHLLAVLGHKEADARTRDRAVSALCGILRVPSLQKEAGPELMDGYRLVLEMVLEDRTGDDGRSARGTILQTLAGFAEKAHEDDQAIRLHVRSVREIPRNAGSAARSIGRLLLGKPQPIDGYDALRAKAKPIFEELKKQASAYRDGLPENANERVIRSAERTVERLDKALAPFDLLGKPAPAWTLHHAFADVKSLDDVKGKVVVVDFWATWCGWCIKSFPAIRVLLEEHSDDPLVLLGVTTPFPYVYGSRYDLDDDLKHKAVAGERPKPAALLEGQRVREGVPVLPEAEYRKMEIAVLQQFIQNHEITWPMLMIQAGEPASMYALQGWPHAMVLDKQGRIRFFKSGALLKDRPEALEAFRAKLKRLLEEQ